MKKIFLTLAILAGIISSAQVKIGDNVTTLDANSLLELESTNKGVLFPRVALINTTSSDPLTAHVAGMVVYNTATTGDVTTGMYANDGAKWVKMGFNSGTWAVSSKFRKVTSLPIVWSNDDYLINVEISSSQNINLPSAVGNAGRTIAIRNSSPAAGTGGAYTYTPNVPQNTTTLLQNRGHILVSDGVNWISIGY